jgi:hypothetical protein
MHQVRELLVEASLDTFIRFENQQAPADPSPAFGTLSHKGRGVFSISLVISDGFRNSKQKKGAV